MRTSHDHVLVRKRGRDVSAVVGFHRDVPKFSPIAHVHSDNTLDKKADELLPPGQYGWNRWGIAGFVVESVPDYLTVYTIKTNDAVALAADRRVNHATDYERSVCETVSPRPWDAPFFADEFHAQFGVVNLPLDFARLGVEAVEGASTALREHLSLIDNRSAAWSAWSLSVLKHWGQFLSPLLGAVGNGEGDHGFVSVAILKMKNGSVGHNRRGQAFPGLDLPEHAWLVGQGAHRQALGRQNTISGGAAPLGPVCCVDC